MHTYSFSQRQGETLLELVHDGVSVGVGACAMAFIRGAIQGGNYQTSR